MNTKPDQAELDRQWQLLVDEFDAKRDAHYATFSKVSTTTFNSGNIEQLNTPSWTSIDEYIQSDNELNNVIQRMKEFCDKYA